MISDCFLINGSFLNYLRSEGLIGSSNPIISEVSVISEADYRLANLVESITEQYGDFWNPDEEMEKTLKEMGDRSCIVCGDELTDGGLCYGCRKREEEKQEEERSRLLMLLQSGEINRQFLETHWPEFDVRLKSESI